MGFINFNINIDKIIEKYNLKKSSMIILLIVSVLLNLYFLVPPKYNFLKASISDPVINNGNNDSPIFKPIPQDSGEPILCTEGRFEENLNEWQIKHYDQVDDDGFYCPKSWSSFLSPDIWYNQLVPMAFDSLRFKYKAKNRDNSTSTPSAFILTIGENPTIARFYITEDNYQMVGFQRINLSDQELVREDGMVLIEPVQCGTEVDLKVRSIIEAGNKIKLVFNLSYISAESGRLVEDSLTYDINLPDPTPESSMIKIGFGTLKGHCIKPISYEICPGVSSNLK